MLKKAAQGAVAEATILVIGSLIGGAIGGAIMTGMTVTAVIGNVIFAANTRNFVMWALENSRWKIVMFYLINLIPIIGAFIVGANIGAEGVIAFVNGTILARSIYSISDWTGLAVLGAVLGAVIGAVGAYQETHHW